MLLLAICSGLPRECSLHNKASIHPSSSSSILSLSLFSLIPLVVHLPSSSSFSYDPLHQSQDHLHCTIVCFYLLVNFQFQSHLILLPRPPALERYFESVFNTPQRNHTDAARRNGISHRPIESQRLSLNSPNAKEAKKGGSDTTSTSKPNFVFFPSSPSAARPSFSGSGTFLRLIFSSIIAPLFRFLAVLFYFILFYSSSSGRPLF